MHIACFAPTTRSKLHPESSSKTIEKETMEKKRFSVDTLESSKGERDEWTADLSQLFIGNKFASGAYSRIFRGIYKQKAVAVKMITIPTHKGEETKAKLEQQFNSEVALLSRLCHPNIVQFIAVCKKPAVNSIITEYMSQGDLRMYLNNQKPYSLSNKTVLRLALDISRGMEYLHSQGVIHRDLKSSNLLLNDVMKAKVADFGTSCIATQCREFKGMGTYRWMAPEMIKEKVYTRKVDVYSFGIVLWELTTGLLPFQGMTPVQAAFAVAEKNERPPLSAWEPALDHLIKRCWLENPSKRPEFSQIVAVLEKYEECVKEGSPLPSASLTKTKKGILDRLKGSSSSRYSSSSVHVNA